MKQPDHARLLGTDGAGRPVFSLPSAFVAENGDSYYGDGSTVRCLQDGVWVTLMPPHSMHIKKDSTGLIDAFSALVDANMDEAESVAAYSEGQEVVTRLREREGDELQIIHLDPAHQGASLRKLKVRLRGLRSVRISGDIVFNRAGVWFLLPSTDFPKPVLAGLQQVGDPGWPENVTVVLVRVDPKTGDATPQISFDFGYREDTSGAITDAAYDSRFIAPFGPDEVAVLQNSSSLAIIKCDGWPGLPLR